VSAATRLAYLRSVVFELRHTFQGVLRRGTEYGMVRVPFTFRRRCCRRCSGTICRSIRPRTGRCRRRSANGFVDEFEFAHFNFDVGLCQGSRQTDYHTVDLSRLVQQNFADIAKLFVLIVSRIATFRLGQMQGQAWLWRVTRQVKVCASEHL
jgi:hypothetical protein